MRVTHTLHGPIDPRSLFALKFAGASIGSLSAALTLPLGIAALGKAHWRAALILAGLLGTEPLLIEQSRIAHLDMTSLGLAWLGFLASLAAFRRESWRFAILAGAAFGAACVNRISYTLLPATLMLILLGHCALSRFRDWRGLRVAVIASAAAVVTLFVLWPALWVHPIDTLVRSISLHRSLAESDHSRAAKGELPVMTYVRGVLALVPYDTWLFALIGVISIGWMKDLRKPYAWLMLALVPYLAVISSSSKQSIRYILPIAPLLLLLAGLGLEWLIRLTTRRFDSKRVAYALAGALGVFLVGRFAWSASLLPTAQQCTPWPGLSCSSPPRMYFMHDVALAISSDQKARGKHGAPRVYAGADVRLMSPWLVAKRAKSPRKATYVVVWEDDYSDAEKGVLTPRARKRLGRLGKALGTIRHDRDFVARVYRR